MEESDHVQWLRKELARWHEEGLISADQAAGIVARYEGEGAFVAEGKARRLGIQDVLGAITTGLFVVILASDWQPLAPLTKIIMVILALAWTLRIILALRGVF